MNQDKTLVFVGAHPDDGSFGMGATLAKYVAQGVKTYYICATRGEAGTVSPEDLDGYSGIAELRCAEMASAAAKCSPIRRCLSPFSWSVTVASSPSWWKSLTWRRHAVPIRAPLYSSFPEILHSD